MFIVSNYLLQTGHLHIQYKTVYYPKQYKQETRFNRWFQHKPLPKCPFTQSVFDGLAVRLGHKLWVTQCLVRSLRLFCRTQAYQDPFLLQLGFGFGSSTDRISTPPGSGLFFWFWSCWWCTGHPSHGRVGRHLEGSMVKLLDSKKNPRGLPPNMGR